MAQRYYGDLHGSRKSAGGSVSIPHFLQPIILPQVGLCRCYKHRTVNNPFPFLNILIFRGKKKAKKAVKPCIIQYLLSLPRLV